MEEALAALAAANAWAMVEDLVAREILVEQGQKRIRTRTEFSGLG
jgi:hypothetical protein